MTETETGTTLDELKQRSHDYALGFIDLIFGTIVILFLLAGVIVLCVSGLTSHPTINVLTSCVLFVGGTLLFMLLTAVRILKDIRSNTREALAIQKQRKFAACTFSDDSVNDLLEHATSMQ